MRPPPERWLVVGILLAYLLVAGLFALRTPDWQAPDEPAHYNYVAQIAGGTLLPTIGAGDWDNAYLESLKAARFAPDQLARLATIRYENHQPPLYYWLQAPVYALSGGSLTALRFASVLLGGLTIGLTYLIGREVFPQPLHIAIGGMGFVAFLPQHVAILASVNNDALAGVVIALLLWASLRYLRADEAVRPWHLGLLVGVAFITKTTTYFMAGVVLLAVMLRHWPQRAALLRAVIGLVGAALPFALFWWGRNVLVYGFPDFLGLGAHDAVVVGQPRTADWIADAGFGGYLRSGLQTTFNSFWGQFGWMAAPLPGWLYPLLLALTLVIVSGLIVRGVRRSEVGAAWRIWAVLWAIIALTAAQFIFYNTTFVQFQGRYLFTAIIPLGLCAALGLETWRMLLLARLAWSRWLVALAYTPLALLDVYLIWRVIPGVLSPDFL